jgi:hypothetical protein
MPFLGFGKIWSVMAWRRKRRTSGSLGPHASAIWAKEASLPTAKAGGDIEAADSLHAPESIVLWVPSVSTRVPWWGFSSAHCVAHQIVSWSQHEVMEFQSRVDDGDSGRLDIAGIGWDDGFAGCVDVEGQEGQVSWR